MTNNTTNAIAALNALVNNRENRSDSALIRELIDEIEAALSAGVKLKRIHESLQLTLEIKMNFSSFEKTLYRIRKRRKVSGQPRIVSKAPPPTTVNSDKTATETKRIPRITNPKELYESQQELRIEIDNYAQDHQYEE